LLTTEFAPIAILSAITIFPKILAPGPIYTLFPICGAETSSLLDPIFVQACILQFSPILTFLFTTIVPL
jgi:hypothetical protein